MLKERYRAIKLIGQGGFGKTFLAVDEDKPSKPRCVIKQFFPQAQGTNNTQKAAELFEQEAVRLDELGKYAQIPELLAHFTQDNRQYLVQEFIDGQNLAQILEAEGAFNEKQILDLLNSLLPVLQFIHSHNVIHRDIKPENIIRRNNGQLVLVDFGAAKYMTGTALFQTGTTIGTPEYVAPEQTRGKAVFASDLYSLGVTCIHLLTEVSPFELFDINDNTWIWEHYLANKSISYELKFILDKLIESAMNRRYQSASDVLEDLNVKKIETMTGMWYGEFGSKPSTLIVTKQSDNDFEGFLEAKERNGKIYKIAIEGKVEFIKNEIIISEKSVIQDPLGWWKLGKNKGILSSDKKQLSGVGQDSRGNYSWNFSKSNFLVGNWYGKYGNKESVLEVTEHSNESFKGILIYKGLLTSFKIQIEGYLNYKNNEIKIREIKVISDPLDWWRLGENQGTLSSDGKRMSGTGIDESKSSYSWSFSRGCR